MAEVVAILAENITAARETSQDAVKSLDVAEKVVAKVNIDDAQQYIVSTLCCGT